MLTEKLLQFIWQFQYYQTQHLLTSSGDRLQILQPGTLNSNQGPDFLHAQIKIETTLWAGNIEIHIKSSDWLLHKHGQHEAYQNVILHVVWIDDMPIKDTAGKNLPTLVLASRVPKAMLQQYEKLMDSPGFVSCQSFLPVLSQIGWQNWLERLLIERLQNRSSVIFQKLDKLGNHWEEVFWQILARNFGVPVNADAFESIAQSISVFILAKHKNQIQQIEALLLGQAQLLEVETEDNYVLLLQREYYFLTTKFSLQKASVKPVFLRMRPANFPTVRLAQLAMLIHQSEHLFSKIIEAEQVTEVVKLLNVTANDFWHYHYQLHTTTPFLPKVLGEQMAENIVINGVVPIVFAYGLFHQKQAYKDKAVEWLLQLKGERNNIIQKWNSFGVISEKALYTQGLLELKKSYCDARNCLHCAIGNKILKQPVLIESFQKESPKR